MRIKVLPVMALALVVSTGALLVAAELHPAQPGSLTVHEWGTFTSVAGEDGTAVDWDALGGKNDLPGFVNDFGYRCFKWRLRGTVRMETPVLYFYSSRELDARVKVTFPQGLITEWFPRADYEVFQKNRLDGSVRRLEANLNGIDTSLRSLTGGIEWKNIKVQPNAAPALPVEGNPSRYYAARGTDAAPLAVGNQQEKFLFYRGVGRFAVPLSARVSADGKVLIENRGPDAVPGVILFENRGGRLGYRNVGAVKTAVALDSPALDGSFPQLQNSLETTLVAEGLYPREAQAMIETWKDSWFEEGSRLIYIVPSGAIDAILPLQIEPAPSAVARVFVGRIELITSATRRAVTEAMDTSDWSKIERYGRFLDPILTRLATEIPAKADQIQQVRQKAWESSGSGRCR